MYLSWHDKIIADGVYDIFTPFCCQENREISNLTWMMSEWQERRLVCGVLHIRAGLTSNLGNL